MILCILLFLFKFDNSFPMYHNKFTNLWLWLPFIGGLLIPPLFISIYNQNNKLKNLFEKSKAVNEVKINKNFNTVITVEFIGLLILGIVIIIYSIITNIGKSIINYVIYVILLIGICILLYVFRDKTHSYTDILLNKFPSRFSKGCQVYNNDTVIDISSHVIDISKNPSQDISAARIIVQTTGQQLEPNLSFFAWIILLLIPFNNSIVINVINGILLGYFVSRVSLYGIQYPLVRKPNKFCKSNDKGECLYKGIDYPVYDTADFENLKNLSTLTDTLKNRINTNSWTIMGIALIIISLVFMIMISS